MARKLSLLLNESQKEFQKVFASLCDRNSSWQVWTDFVECTAIEISGAVDRDSPVRETRENTYKSIMKRYKESERDAFAQMFCILVRGLELQPEQDFLGEMFMVLELGNHWKGQFFTPYNVCSAMAKIQIAGSKNSIEQKGWIGIQDPACGAGTLMIAARNELVEQHCGSRQTLFVCQDIDHVAGLMCYIQLSLLGCAGYVCIADSLCNPVCGPSPLLPIIKEDQDFWFMPMFYDEIWQSRIVIERLKSAERAMEQKQQPLQAQHVENESMENKQVVPQSDAGGQLAFF